MTTKTPCTRCDNGYIKHEAQNWAVRCPRCFPGRRDEDTVWILDETTGGHRAVNAPIDRRKPVPIDRPALREHPSQQIVPMPAFVRAALTRSRTAAHTKRNVLEGIAS